MENVHINLCTSHNAHSEITILEGGGIWGGGVVGIQRKANRVPSSPPTHFFYLRRFRDRFDAECDLSKGVARGGVAWPTRMPVSRRARFAPPRRTNREARHGPDAETGGDEVGIVQSAEGLQVEPAPDGSMLKDIALTLWTPTYDPVFQLELERNRAALASRGGTLGGFGLTVHAKRLTGHHRVKYGSGGSLCVSATSSP